MDSDTFFHYLYTPAWKHRDILWGPRLPRKVCNRTSQSPSLLAQGWGIQIRESPHSALVATLMFLFLAVSGVVAGVYAWRTGGSQTSVAIGTWLTTVQAMGLAAWVSWQSYL